MNCMNDKLFIDTNIFVYATLEDSNNREKRHKITIFLQNISDEIIISTQIINEFYSAMLKNKVSNDEIQEKINELLPTVNVVLVKLDTIRSAWHIKREYKLSYWDSLIIASALESECKILYSEDMQHNLIIENQLKIINPFKKEF